VSEIEVKVYYEDTDCLGVVYHANYLKYFERARTELVGELGKSIDQWNAEGFNFVVFKMDITWHKPGKLNDRLRVVTERVPHRSGFRFVLDQKIFRAEELLVEAEVHVVCVDANMQLRRIPDELLLSEA
jgi:tol-pal system-associated acyl-CoA thioesterase